ncbi:MAG: hypothetical protein HFH64_01800 [Lachnospiraceae bacterium]|nr:hypothetical protein [Lachnospiraceae bacterium]
MSLYPCEKSYPDAAFLKTMYPQSVTLLYEHISDAADKLEYERSFMFDEYPDRELVLKFVGDIYTRVLSSIPSSGQTNSYLYELIAVMTINEFIHRRMRKREF